MPAYPVCQFCEQQHSPHRACLRADLDAARGASAAPELVTRNHKTPAKAPEVVTRNHEPCARCAELQRRIDELERQQCQSGRKPKRDRAAYMRGRRAALKGGAQ